jgi:NAD(P)-dependent dehydrogenase (short-subunit alcohol dehydrogenase family)
MNDKVVFITGANGGLGSSVTKAFLQKGARVIGASLRIKAADFPQPNFEAMAIDFNKLDEIKRGVAKIVERYGRLAGRAGACAWRIRRRPFDCRNH